VCACVCVSLKLPSGVQGRVRAYAGPRWFGQSLAAGGSRRKGAH
jgi:hypothetical protein